MLRYHLALGRSRDIFASSPSISISATAALGSGAAATAASVPSGVFTPLTSHLLQLRLRLLENITGSKDENTLCRTIALKPDIWPLRVAVRHFKPAKQSRDKNWKDQSRNTGGQISASVQNRNTNEQRRENDQRRRSENGANGHLPVGHPNQKSNQQQSTSIVIDPIKMNNFFEVLGKLGGQDISFKK